MDMSKHTPHPWKANEDGLVWSESSELGVHNIIGSFSPADAALIAAAPELLAALIEMASGHSMAGEVLARAAIAKATGETP